MNRFLIASFFALSLMIGATGAAPVAHAAAEGSICDYTDAGTQDGTIQNGKCVSNGTYGFNNSSGTPAENIAANAAALKAANQTPTVNQGSSNTAFNPVMSAIAGLFAWLVGVAALVLDWTVYYTVVNMGAYINKLTAIGVTWRILRDIGNIMLIFGFLAIGISVILNTERIGYGKKMLPMLLVAAVFLNFSLFFSEAIIDTGNLFATQFYTQINGGVTPTADTLKGITTANQGISSKLMSQLGLQSIYDVQKNSALLKDTTPWYIGFLAILLFIVTAFVMFSLAFILIARFIVLVFLIILAPIGFAGLAVPQLARKAGQWWSALFQQTITAPVLLLLLYVALAVITDAQFLTGLGGGSAGAVTGFVDNNNLAAFASYVMSFSIAIGLMLAVTISAKGLSAFGADKATALAGKLSFGATAFGLRSTLGWGSQGAAQAIRRKYGGTKTGRLLATTFDKGAKASFDVRGATLGGGLKGIGVDAGEAQKGGYRKRREDAIKGHQDYIKSVGEAIDEKGISKEDEAKITKAEEVKAGAEEAHDRAQKEHAIAKQQFKPQIDQHQAEVSRLTKEQEDNLTRGGLPDPDTDRKLDAAKQVLATSKAGLKAISDKEVAANNAFQDAIKEETRVGKEANKGITAEKRKAQLAYAENISGSFPGWVMYGPGGSAAAKKIVKDAKKSPDKILLDSLKKAIATGEKSDTPAPAAPAPVATKP